MSDFFKLAGKLLLGAAVLGVSAYAAKKGIDILREKDIITWGREHGGTVGDVVILENKIKEGISNARVVKLDLFKNSEIVASGELEIAELSSEIERQLEEEGIVEITIV